MTEGAVIQEGLVVRPGDQLLIRVPLDTPRGRMDALADDLVKRFRVRVFVIAAEELAVVRGG